MNHNLLQPNYCPYCSDDNQKISHGGPCPKVKSIEYFQNGTIKKVEFHDKLKPVKVGENIER